MISITTFIKNIIFKAKRSNVFTDRQNFDATISWNCISLQKLRLQKRWVILKTVHIRATHMVEVFWGWSKLKRSKNKDVALPQPTFNLHLVASQPGLTKTSNHTISIYEKLLVIQFHTMPYVQNIVWNLYDKDFSINEYCMIGVFP